MLAGVMLAAAEVPRVMSKEIASHADEDRPTLYVRWTLVIMMMTLGYWLERITATKEKIETKSVSTSANLPPTGCSRVGAATTGT